jgi:short subunit fatty acids transporter
MPPPAANLCELVPQTFTIPVGGDNVVVATTVFIPAVQQIETEQVEKLIIIERVDRWVSYIGSEP